MEDETLEQTCLIALGGHGGHAVVDAEDYPRLAPYYWRQTKLGYVIRRVTINGKRIQIWLHREVMRAPPEFMTDHINGDKLDNRKTNLRLCVSGENKRNQKKYRDAISPYKGVTLRRYDGKWCARVRHEGKLHHIGYFRDPVDAALAYNDRAIQLHGEFARINVLPELVISHLAMLMMAGAA